MRVKTSSMAFGVAATLAAFATMSSHGTAQAASTADDLNRDADQALRTLYRTNPIAADIAKQSRAVLVFPNIVKAGLIFGGAYGEGVLKVGQAVDGYYNSITASFGLQAGGQSYGYVVFLMNDRAVNYIHKSYGWELGTDPA